MKTYKEMSTKKLNALLTNASPEEVVIIEAELAARESEMPSDENATDEVATTEAEDKFLEGLDKAEASKANIAPSTKIGKLTLEEAEALAESLQGNVNHRCQVVPFNTIEWADGTIAGVVADKRSARVLYAIRCDDGKRIFKAHDSKMLVILDEVATEAQKVRKVGAKKEAAAKFSLDELMTLAEELSVNVGKHITFKPSKDFYVVRESDQAIVDVTELTGVIVAITPEKRAGTILYRINCNFVAYDQEGVDTEEGPATKMIELVVHKVYNNSDIQVLDTYDETVRSKYVARQNATPRVTATPSEKLIALGTKYQKLVDQQTKLTKMIEDTYAAIETLQAEIAGNVAEESTETTTA